MRLFSPISMNTVPSTTSSPFMRGGAGAQVLADRDLGDVADDDRRAVVRRDADRANLVERGDLARHAHQVLAAEALDVAGADVDVVALERCREVASVRPNASSAAGRGATTYCRSLPPIMLTSVTPGTRASCGRTTQSMTVCRSVVS